MGAARFLRGLRSLLEPRALTVVVNTGDDECFFGLHVSPDVDTILYTLADLASPAQGWGIAGDSFRCLQALGRLYPETWFQLGDLDLATHIYRTDSLRRGQSLSAVTAQLAPRLGVRQRILPMTDDKVRTFVDVAGQGPLPFQQYLVRRRGRGRVHRIEARGVEKARPAAGVLSSLRRASAILLPPSNPFVSIGPILALPGVRPLLQMRRARVAAISPIVGGAPVKGPLHRMLRGLGHEVSPVAVARLYQDVASVFILDRRDARLAPRIADLGMRPVVTDTLMTTPARARRLAETSLRALDRSTSGRARSRA